MQHIVHAIQEKMVNGKELSLAEHAVLHLYNETSQLNAKMDTLADQQKAILEQQQTILETFQQGTGAIKFFKIMGAIVAPLAGLAGLWHLFSSKAGG